MSDSKLVTYNKRLPHEAVPLSITALGIVLLLAGLIMFTVTMIQLVGSEFYPTSWSNSAMQPFLTQLRYDALVFVTGMVVFIAAGGYYALNYQEVYQGKIISLDMPGTECAALVEGYTHSNELKQAWLAMNPQKWREAEVGDYYKR